MSLVHLLRQRAEVRRAACAVDAVGDGVRAWTVLEPSRPCAVELLDARIEAGPDGRRLARRARAFMVPGGDDGASVGDRDPAPGDRVAVGADTWDVRAARVEIGAYAALLVVDLVG